MEALSENPHSMSTEGSFSAHSIDPEECVVEKNTYSFFVPKLHCAACIWLIETALTRIEGVDYVTVNLMSKTVKAACVPQGFSQLVSTLTSLGYKPFPPLPSHSLASKGVGAKRHQVAQLGISGLIFSNVMLLTVGVYFGDYWGMDPTMRLFLQGLSTVLSTISLIFPGRIFFTNAWESIHFKTLHIDLPISAALALSYTYTLISLATGGHQFYNDSITGLIFLLLLGRYAQSSLVERSAQMGSLLGTLLPQVSSDLQVGDSVEVRGGDIVPADGQVEEGEGEVNEASLTGEPLPVHKMRGDSILAGSQAINGRMKVRVTHVGESSQIGQLEKILKLAKRNKTHVENKASSILPIFSLCTVFISLMGGGAWLFKDPSHALSVTVASLIVTCPCALALATPLTTALALVRAARHGLLLKGSDVWERLAACKAIVFDKTGTLTSGQFLFFKAFEMSPQLEVQNTLLEPRLLPADWVAPLAAVAATSKHPLSQAVLAACSEVPCAHGERLPPQRVEELPGLGLEALYGGVELKVGKPNWVFGQEALVMPRAGGSEGCSLVAARFGDRRLLFVFKDGFYPTLRAMLGRLQKRYEVIIASGDPQACPHTLARRLGLHPRQILVNASPEDKLQVVEALEAFGKKTVMVGDGVNDAPALARATVGLAASGGVDLSLSHADGILKSSSIVEMASILGFSRRVLGVLYCNIFISLLYNALALTLVLSGNIHPLGAALIMPLASLTSFFISWLQTGEKAWKSYLF